MQVKCALGCEEAEGGRGDLVAGQLKQQQQRVQRLGIFWVRPGWGTGDLS